MIDCSEFLELYSDFRDEVLDAGLREDCVLHLAICESCARYHRVVHRGIETLLALPEISPSEGFLERLDRELVRAARETRPASGAPVGLVFALAAAIGAAAWLPALRVVPEPQVLPAVVAQAPVRQQLLPVVTQPSLLPSYARRDRSVEHWFSEYPAFTLLGGHDAGPQPQFARFGVMSSR